MHITRHIAPCAHPYHLLLALAWSAPALAQLPDAGQSLRDIESTRPQLAPSIAPELELSAPSRPEVVEPDSGPRLRVAGFRFSGNTAFDAATLAPLLQDLAGRELGMAELSAAAERLTRFYQRHGYLLARAYLPPQEIEAGEVSIAIQEGHYGAVELDNASRTRDQVLRAPLRGLEGRLVERDALDEALLRLNDLPGVNVRATLRPGTQAGRSDLLLQAQPGALLSGGVELDNYGGKYTGEYRLGGSLNLNSPLTLGDQLSLRAMGSDGRQQYQRISYQLPLGPWLTRLGAAYSNMEYRLGRSLSDLGMHGNARITSGFVSQALRRGRNFSLHGQLLYEDKQLKDDIEFDGSRSVKRARLWTATLSANGQDGLGGGGLSQLSLAYSAGELRMEDPLAQWWDYLTTDTQGSFGKLSLSGVRLQRLSTRLSLYAQLNAQWASRNLDSSEKISLGGPYAVRAYPAGDASGDEGWIGNLEARYAAWPGVQAALFYDYGQTRANKRGWGQLNPRLQRGALGLGLGWQQGHGQLNVSAAWRVSAGNAAPERGPTIWAQASWLL
ncbi:ShlB/FhaC/HecB family hemolysin secretion/activation protein [Chromobacterium aquaticum]|uniref:ShlB/FhaC/HecB family hemolysin secretion/activation protein n=1 Tax=Chromobacterium aquaticum TaxID=467180 RepID=A0ABV8ZX82_9NEIS|nr:ShlB/FhaC/HecB family hemolysin secretion/activation protein [Chromobacterium aquaticum]MCD5364010.1 ShlB/FhaC/HecB family hemolysin secretion/activation protein [Chromobacterium aquaticum]